MSQAPATRGTSHDDCEHEPCTKPEEARGFCVKHLLSAQDGGVFLERVAFRPLSSLLRRNSSSGV